MNKGKMYLDIGYSLLAVGYSKGGEVGGGRTSSSNQKK